ncbi:MAG TPA: hypothetical protein VNU26_18895 [Mycobacteriales bacterium]|nr:hypothetical protein [Mycobacteriales bacterium]
MPAARPGPNEAVLAAVLSALAGARIGDRVAAVGAGSRTTTALLAMSGTDRLVDDDARVVVAGAAHDVPLAVARLAPGGRLVAVAADAGAARRVAAAHGLDLRHVEPVGRLVAWSAVRPVEAPGSSGNGAQPPVEAS